MGQLKTTAFLLALLASAGAGAQQATYKCTDKAGKVTYSSIECHLLGLKGQGEVVNRMNTSPAYKPPPRPAVQPSSGPAPATASQASAPAAAKPADGPDPNRRCFTRQVKTAKGVSTVTNCNEKPDESAAPAVPADARDEVRAQ